MDISYYAGAADAAGTDHELLDTPDLTAGELMSLLGSRHVDLVDVLSSCSLLVDGAPVQDPAARISSAARVDVLPPFAGG